ncbi:unnamed protein product [Owenia fusiformis]|uniref:Uncharacterized protein n=1 Tax=Owenia fusiformis TaxID=6347 RepID=A0A8J1Y7W2_OWEFU|nr:unnamed protein product [Owenia fusiformis]
MDFLSKAGVGRYPAGYNAKVHGPYNPAVNYGKPDAALSEVKLGQLGSWLSRRSFGPGAIVRACSRGWHRYAQKWILVKKPGVAPVAQLVGGLCFLYFLGGMKSRSYHRHAKYH